MGANVAKIVTTAQPLVNCEAVAIPRKSMRFAIVDAFSAEILTLAGLRYKSMHFMPRVS